MAANLRRLMIRAQYLCLLSREDGYQTLQAKYKETTFTAGLQIPQVPIWNVTAQELLRRWVLSLVRIE